MNLRTTYFLLGLWLALWVKIGRAQPALPYAPVTLQPTIDYGVNGYVIQRWTVGNLLHAQQVLTNWSAKAVIITGSPKSGGTVTNYVPTFSLVTNQVTALRDMNGQIYAFTLPAPMPQPWDAFEIRNLETSTNLIDWQPVGWDCRREPMRWFRIRGPLDLVHTNFH